jgi:hypothetical protein
MRNLTTSLLFLALVACGKSGDSKTGDDKARSTKPRDMVAERAKIAEFKDKACACKDPACANKVAEDLKAWMMTDRGVAPEGTKEDSQKDLDVMTAFMKCLDAARHGG